MSKTRLRFSALLLALGLAAPVPAFASGADISQIFYDLMGALMPVWVPVAVLTITVAAFMLLVSTEEGALNKARNSIIAVIVGGMLIMVGPVLLGAFYRNVGGTVVEDTSWLINAEAMGIVGWLSAIAGMFGMMFVIVAAIRAVGSFGQDEESYNKVRFAILHIVFGLIIMSAAGLISNSISSGMPNPLMDLILGKIQILLGVMSAVALGIMVYAGFRMMTNFGQEEVYTQAKALAIRVLMGIGIILLAYAMTIFVGQLFG